MDWQSLAILALGLWLGSTVALMFVRRFAAEQPRCEQPRNPPQPQPVHWVPTRLVGSLQMRLVKRGYLVVNIASTNGMTLLAILEGRA